MRHQFSSFLVVTFLASAAAAGEDAPNVGLFEWQRGFAVRSLDQKDMAVYLWFYEWHMFEAIRPGQHTGGTYKLDRTLSKDGRQGGISSDAMTLRVAAATDGADLELTVRNRTEYDFPPIAAIIPCFNPGPADTRNREFANANTHFLGPDGFKKLVKREIHFNEAVRESVDREAQEGQYAWSHKWPLSETNAVGGLIVRESTGGKWVCGIAWEDFLSAQAHNPWECMHLSIRVGPLRRGQSKAIRGRIYLFQGNKEDVLDRYREDFGIETPESE